MGALEPQRVSPREVVAALRLSPAARARLQEALGDGVRLVDIKGSTRGAGLVICPPCSPQTIGALRHQFPSARIVVAEVEDAELGVEVGGPVTRSLEAGASAYLTASSLKDLAAMLNGEAQPTGPGVNASQALPRPSADDEILAALASLAGARAKQEQP